MAKPSKAHAEMIVWTALITAVVTVLVQRAANRTIEAKNRLTHPARQVGQTRRDSYGAGGPW